MDTAALLRTHCFRLPKFHLDAGLQFHFSLGFPGIYLLKTDLHSHPSIYSIYIQNPTFPQYLLNIGTLDTDAIYRFTIPFSLGSTLPTQFIFTFSHRIPQYLVNLYRFMLPLSFRFPVPTKYRIPGYLLNIDSQFHFSLGSPVPT